MTKDYSRRKILRTSAISSFAGAVLSGLSNRAVASNNEPSADSEPELFRLIDSGSSRDDTTVQVIKAETGAVLDTNQVKTTGTNHPDMQGMSHEQRFPHVAADIDSFGELPPGEYELKVKREDLHDKTTFVMGVNGGLPDGNVLHARILPDDKLRVRNTHSDPATEP